MARPSIHELHGSFNVTRRTHAVAYIVCHYTGSGTPSAGSAEANCRYFAGGNRNASAHYFIDDSGIWEYADPSAYATWHCGDGHGRYGITNANSIGIEVCQDGDRPYTSAEIAWLAQLVRWLMERFGVDAAHVVRHYDASRKACPYYYTPYGTGGDAAWKALHDTITSGEASTPTITRLTEDTMECIINWNDEGKMVWFDGTRLHWLDEPDTMKAVQEVYARVAAAKKADPNNIPVFTVGEEGAPWASRFAEAVGDGSEELSKFPSDHK